MQKDVEISITRDEEQTLGQKKVTIRGSLFQKARQKTQIVCSTIMKTKLCSKSQLTVSEISDRNC